MLKDLKMANQQNPSSANESAIDSINSAITSIKAAKKVKAKKNKTMKVTSKSNRVQKASKIRGRGLLGAGISGYNHGGITLKGKTLSNGMYNLDDIQDKPMRSAHNYRKIGTKYIRIPNLIERNQLVISYPNRRDAGPRRVISDKLQAMIKQLIYNNEIKQQSYSELSYDDQRLFKEILAKTNLQNHFDVDLPDVRKNMQMEYEKLKGEVMLGNDNADIRSQLKELLIQMFSNQLISDKEFKQIIAKVI